MARRFTGLGRSLSQVISEAPFDFLKEFLASCRSPEGHLLAPSALEMIVQSDDPKNALEEYLKNQAPDILRELDRLSGSVLELSEGKGITSLDTVASKKLYHEEYENFLRAPDALCRSIWVQSRHPETFRDAESFYAVRRYRDHRKLYAAFEVDQDDPLELSATRADTDGLCRRLEELLKLRAKATASVLDLPETSAHPPSLLIALRHAGALSSIRDHREDGNLKTYYYRPSHEAVLIYTPKQRKIEVCAESFNVRKIVADTFAETVLQQDLSAKPLTKRDFNLDRFRESFDLDLPDLDDAEVTNAAVVEAEMPLGNWARRLNMKVARDESIERAMRSYIRDSSRLVRKFGFSKIVIAVEFTHRGEDKKGTLRLQVSGGNTSNVQSQKDPFLRSLGLKLLGHWGMMDELRPLTEAEEARWFQFLLSLFDLPDDDVSGSFFVAEGVDTERLIQSGFLKRKPRQVLVLIDDDGDGVVEGDLTAGPEKGTVLTQCGFGEVRGTISDANAITYEIDRRWLAEKILKLLGGALGAVRMDIESSHLVNLGMIELGSRAVPVFLARELDSTKVIDELDLALRQKHKLGPGIVLSASGQTLSYLGPNVVIGLNEVVSVDGDAISVHEDELNRRFEAGRTLIANAQVAQIIRHGPQAGVLILPGKDPLNLTSANQVRFFERLVKAANDGTGEVLTKVLTEGMGADHPKNLFSAKLRSLVLDKYICHGSSNRYWRLRSGVRDLIAAMDR